MFRRYALRCAAALTVIAALSGCATHAPKNQPLISALAHTSSISTFNTLVVQAGLVQTLDTTGPYTVFAPSNDAFKAVPAKTMAALQADKVLLKEILSYHIVQGRMQAADIQPGNVKTLQSATVSIARTGPYLTIEDAMVQQPEVLAINGIVHVIDRVLQPPTKK